MFQFVIASVLGLALTACVSSKRYEETKEKLQETRKKEAVLRKELQSLQLQSQDQQVLIGQLERKLGRASVDKESYKASIQQMKQALSEATARKLETDKRLNEYKRLAKKLKSFTETAQLSVKIVEGRMVVALPGDVLFSSGSSSLSRKGKETVRKVGKALKSIDGRKFQVEGHTDNVPIKTSKFPSNWELASARATTVVKEMIDGGMPKERISAASFSFYKPVASNESAQGRELNRRIEVVIVPDMSALPGYEELTKLSEDQNQKK